MTRINLFRLYFYCILSALIYLSAMIIITPTTPWKGTETIWSSLGILEIHKKKIDNSNIELTIRSRKII